MKTYYMWTIVDDQRRFVYHKYTHVAPQIEQPQVIQQSYLSIRIALERLGYVSALSDDRRFKSHKDCGGNCRRCK
jgi:hypothetical protein